MDDRLVRLESRVEELTALAQSLATRLAMLEGTADRPVAHALDAATAGAAGMAPALPRAAIDTQVFGALPALIGRSCLVLGGAFLVRALTEAGTLTSVLGVALALAYAVLWVALGDRAGAGGRDLSAMFHLASAAVIAYPLLFESTVRFAVLPPAGSAMLGLALTGLLIGVAWRRDQQLVAWIATGAAIILAYALAITRGVLDVSSVFLILLGAGLLWLTYGRRWHALRWPVAIAADFAVFLLSFIVVREGGPPGVYAVLSPTTAFPIALALPLVYLASFAVRTLVKNRGVVPFEAVQTVLALLAGFGGAVRIAHESGTLAAALGASALLLGLACYGVSFAFVERHDTIGYNFAFYTTLALGLVLLGTTLSGGRGIGLAAFGALAAYLGTRFGRLSLRSHAAVYSVAAFVGAGLAGLAIDTWLGTVAAGPVIETASGLVVACSALVIAILLIRSPAPFPVAPWVGLVPGLAGLTVALVALGSFAVRALCVTLGSFEPGSVASVRSGLLALAAVLIALAARRITGTGLAWVVYALLVLGGVKIVFEDLQAGRPATLLWAFGFYGLSLVCAPWLMRGARETASS